MIEALQPRRWGYLAPYLSRDDCLTRRTSITSRLSSTLRYCTITLLEPVMESYPSASHYLIALCEKSDLQQLSTALDWPSFAHVALQTEGVLVDARTGTISQH
jgi:hypothetical protein